MAVVRPLYWNTTLDLARPLLDIHWEYQRRHIARLYSQAPTVTVSVVSNSGTLSPTMADTRLQAGAEGTRGTSSAPAETATAEPSVVTVNFDKLTGPTYDTSLSPSADQGRVGYPVYWDTTEGCIKVMSHQDYIDTFIYETLDSMATASESELTNGTFTIATSTITNYYLQRRSDASSASTQPIHNLLFADTDGNLQRISKEDDNAFYTRVKNDIRYYAAEDTAGHKLSYNINGSGNARGTAMVDTRLDGSGNYQTLVAGLDDYRAQEFPNGSPATINTYTFKITQV